MEERLAMVDELTAEAEPTIVALDPEPAKPIPSCDPAAVITEASLAKLELESQGAAQARSRLATLPDAECGGVPLVALEYIRPGARRLHTVLAPLDASHDGLTRIAGRLHANGAQLQDMRILRSGGFSSMARAVSAGEVMWTELDGKLQTIQKQATPPPAEEAIDQMILLGEFFLQRAERDGAYLAADNAQRLLANGARAGAMRKERADALFERLDRLQNSLRTRLPFTLSQL